jgi:hypothetical protein
MVSASSDIGLSLDDSPRKVPPRAAAVNGAQDCGQLS